jgi:hypothetical protein
LARDEFDPVSKPDPNPEGSPNTIRVRQGITGQGVRYVLAFGLVGIVIAFAIVAIYA